MARQTAFYIPQKSYFCFGMSPEMQQFSFFGYTTKPWFRQSVWIQFKFNTSRCSLHQNSIHNSIKSPIINFNSVHNEIQLSKFHFKLIHYSIPEWKVDNLVGYVGTPEQKYDICNLGQIGFFTSSKALLNPLSILEHQTKTSKNNHQDHL